MTDHESETVVLRTCLDEIEAEIARGHLEDASIECFVRRFDGGAMLWSEYSPIQDVRVIVFLKDKDKADEILKAMGC